MFNSRQPTSLLFNPKKRKTTDDDSEQLHETEYKTKKPKHEHDQANLSASTAPITAEEAAHKIQHAYKRFKEKKLAAIRTANWMAGTNGIFTLPLLTHTNFELIPTGKLLQKRFAPLCGELTKGIKLLGNNYNHLSGINSLDESGFRITLNYAHLSSPSITSIKYLEEKIEISLKNVIHYLQTDETLDSITLNKVILFILRVLQLRQINENKYQRDWQEICNELIVQLKKPEFWDKCLENFCQSDEYLCTILHKKIPKKLTPIGLEINHRNHKKQDVNKRLQKLRALLDNLQPSVHLSPDELAEMDRKIEKNPKFPIVFMANIPNVANLYVGNVLDEKIYKGTLKLNDDIKLIVTDHEHRHELKKYLREHNLRKIFVSTDTEFVKTRYRSP